MVEEEHQEEVRWRKLEQLAVHRETLQCAETRRCRPCCYKIVLYGCKGLLPNVRPELCPRIQAQGNHETQMTKRTREQIGLYDAAHVKRILTVGDGNFSFSLALAKAFPSGNVQLVATSHETQASVVETYPDGEQIIGELHDMDYVQVHHGIDATNAEQMQTFGKFDRIIWNFPCVRVPRGEDGQNKEMELNKQLLRDFFKHVGAMLTDTGEVHITHKTKPPFGQWGIEELAETNGLNHVQSVVFDRCLYPGYSNKKVLSKGSFPIWDSQTFIFVPQSRPGEKSKKREEEAENDCIVPVTMEMLKKIYLLLTPSAHDMIPKQTKKKNNKRKHDSSMPVSSKNKAASVNNKKRKKTKR